MAAIFVQAAAHVRSFQERHLPAGEAFRTRGLLTSSTRIANAYGHYSVTAEASSAGAGGDAASAEIEAQIGILGLSPDGEPVTDLRADQDAEPG